MDFYKAALESYGEWERHQTPASSPIHVWNDKRSYDRTNMLSQLAIAGALRKLAMGRGLIANNSIAPDFLTPREAAARLGSCDNTVLNLCREGRIVSEKVGNRWLINRARFDEYVDTYRVVHARQLGKNKRRKIIKEETA
jgi:excisionase family DNA binding protein